jgi:hypothetical protein
MRKRVEVSGLKNRRVEKGSLPYAIAVLCFIGGQAEAFAAYDCSNRSNIVESYSLLEPDACTV